MAVCLISRSHPSRIRLHGLVTVLFWRKKEKNLLVGEKMYYRPLPMVFLFMSFLLHVSNTVPLRYRAIVTNLNFNHG